MSLCGDRKDYCDPLRACRYPAAYFRQLQNTLLMRFAPDIVASAFARIRHGRTRSPSLYVDGDISSVSELDFWFRMLADRPDIRAYGYSKSWQVFLEYRGVWPTNYR